jgi:dTDP-4-dehydrorhamnose reductase
MKRILVTGGDGQLGQCFRQLALARPDLRWKIVGRTELDIARPEACRALLADWQPDVCFNAAAYTAVDKAESDEAGAWQVNVDGAAQLAAACAATGCRLLHYSTDYVYAGHYNRPLRETDETDPQGVYGVTKLAGEQAVLQQLPSALIVRTSWVYSAYGHNFLRSMLRLGRERAQLRVVFDQVGSPTAADDLAVASLQMALAPVAAGGGIYNYSHEGVCSWYDFAAAIFEMAGIRTELLPIESADFPTPARRPNFSVLNKTKIKETFGLQIPHWRTGVRRVLNQLEPVSSNNSQT